MSVEKSKLFDRVYFDSLNDEDKETYLMNLICYGIATIEKIDEEE